MPADDLQPDTILGLGALFPELRSVKLAGMASPQAPAWGWMEDSAGPVKYSMFSSTPATVSMPRIQEVISQHPRPSIIPLGLDDNVESASRS